MITTTIDWPSTLPKPTRSGYGYNNGQDFIRTEMANGRATQRTEFISVPAFGSYELVLNSTQAAAFEEWYLTTLGRVKWFNIELKTPYGDNQSLIARFTQRYEGPSLYGNCHWTFRLPLEFYNLPVVQQ